MELSQQGSGPLAEKGYCLLIGWSAAGAHLLGQVEVALALQDGGEQAIGGTDEPRNHLAVALCRRSACRCAR